MSADGPALLRRVRGAMWGLAVYWTLATVVTLASPGEPVDNGMAAPSLWLTAGLPGAVALMHAVVALRFHPGRRTTWGLAVSAAAFSLFGCLTTPVAGWVIWMLFRKPVMGLLLGGRYAD